MLCTLGKRCDNSSPPRDGDALFPNPAPQVEPPPPAAAIRF